MRRTILLLVALAASAALASQPNITQQPADTIAPLGGTATFGVQAAGSGPLSYQWMFNGTNLSQNINTVAGIGTGDHTGDGGPATNAELTSPYGIAVDGAGNLFLTDPSDYIIRKVATNGIITTVAGDGIDDYFGDGGPATNAAIGYPLSMAVDKAGNIYISDTDYAHVRKVSTNGIITTVAGNGSYGSAGDGGAATAAELGDPRGLAVDSAGNLFISDNYENRIRKVDTNGIISTVAGNGDANFYGDGSAATNAALNGPTGVAVDSAGNLFIADNLNNRIRKVAANGIITTIAGNGTSGFLGDGGPATNAALKLTEFCGVAVDPAGNLFVADVDNNCIRRISPNGLISTVSGNVTNGFAGDGASAADAALAGPRSVAVDSHGRVFIADSSNNRIREFGGAWASTLTLDNVSAVQQGNYISAAVADTNGSITSSSAKLTVVLPLKSFTQKASGGNLKIELTGPANFSYILQSTISTVQPITWQPVVTNSADGTGYWSYTITNFSTASRRFFRLSSQ
jgi:streptogramin lyase